MGKSKRKGRPSGAAGAAATRPSRPGNPDQSNESRPPALGLDLEAVAGRSPQEHGENRRHVPAAFLRSGGEGVNQGQRPTSAVNPGKMTRPSNPSPVTRQEDPGQSPQVSEPAGEVALPGPLLTRKRSHPAAEVTKARVGLMTELQPRALGVTYWFQSEPAGKPYPVTVRFTGRRRAETASAKGTAGAADHAGTPARSGTREEPSSFDLLTTVHRVVPGTGQVAVTARVPDLPEGTWDVTARPVTAAGGQADGTWRTIKDPRLPVAIASGQPVFAPVARNLAPGVWFGAWPALVAAGAVAALAIQAWLASTLQVPVGRLVPVSLLACLLGLLGAKAYYLVTHRAEGVNLLMPGMSVQGFVLVAAAIVVAGSLVRGLPLGAVLNTSAAGLMAGMAIGRLGCLFGGCCVGRPTTSRYGVWSSNRSVGVRRIPVQLFEAALSAGLAVAAVVTIAVADARTGLLSVAVLAAYTAGRQLLFPLRELPRSTRHGRRAILAVTGVASVATGLVVVLTCVPTVHAAPVGVLTALGTGSSGCLA